MKTWGITDLVRLWIWILDPYLSLSHHAHHISEFNQNIRLLSESETGRIGEWHGDAWRTADGFNFSWSESSTESRHKATFEKSWSKLKFRSCLAFRFVAHCSAYLLLSSTCLAAPSLVELMLMWLARRTARGAAHVFFQCNMLGTADWHFLLLTLWRTHEFRRFRFRLMIDVRWRTQSSVL